MKTMYFLFVAMCFELIALSISEMNNKDPKDLTEAEIGPQICMNEIGCFTITMDFEPRGRKNFLPWDREIIDTQFLLYSADQPMKYSVLKHNNHVSMTKVDINRPTVFIVSGYATDIDSSEWMQTLKDEIMLYDNSNVILVDWSKGNGFPYPRAAANTRVVGAEIALLIKSLKKHRGLDPMNVHIIGHSLGSHIAGYAGEKLQTLGRITGLDPAGPLFENLSPSVRLDPTDADFVDVIHTDSVPHMKKAFGIAQNCGHIDFYPNDGQKQPGCKTELFHSMFSKGLLEAFSEFGSCNHHRAIDFFLYTFNYQRALPLGFQCSSWTNFLDGLCADSHDNRSALMGMEAVNYKRNKNNSNSTKLYVITSAEPPFWQFLYQVTVKLSTLNDGFRDERGSITLEIRGTESIYIVPFSERKLTPGISPTHLVHESQFLGQIQELTFTWISSSYKDLPKQAINLEYITVKPMNIRDELYRSQEMKFCYEDLSGIKPQSTVKLQNCK